MHLYNDQIQSTEPHPTPPHRTALHRTAPHRNPPQSKTNRSLRCLRFGGRYGVVGWTSTPYAGGGRGAGAVQESANALPTNLIMMKSAKVFGCPVAIATKQDPSIRPPRLAALDAWIACGYIRPLVSHKSPLEDCGEALMQKWGRKVTGGAVVQP